MNNSMVMFVVTFFIAGALSSMWMRIKEQRQVIEILRGKLHETLVELDKCKKELEE